MGRSGLRRGEGGVERHGAGYRARWYDAEGKRRSKSFPTEAAARAWLVTRDLTRAEPAAVTVEQAVTAYLTRGARRWAAGTTFTYRQRARDHLIPALGSLTLAKLSTSRVQRWVDELDAGGLAPGTIQPTLAILSGALKEAVRLDLVERNVAEGVRVPSIARRPATVWSAAQARAVLTAATEPRWQAVYQLMLTAGLRPGELRALRWEDVDWAAARLRVRRTVSHAEGGGYTVHAGTKRGDGRVVSLTLPALAALRTWQREAAGDSWVFGGEVPLPQMVWTRAHRKLCADAGVPVIRLHDLRHTCATLLLERGVHPKIVGDMLGHRRIEVTLDLYSHTSTDLIAAAQAGLADWLNTGEDQGGVAEAPDSPQERGTGSY